jgi:hypothetical protein
MQLVILVEPKEGGGFRATAGEPFRLSAEGASAETAAREVESLVRQQLQRGAQLAVVEIDNGAVQTLEPPLRLEALPEDDWFFTTLRDVIDSNRRREDEAGA